MYENPLGTTFDEMPQLAFISLHLPYCILSNSSLGLYSLSLAFRLGVDFVLLLSQEEDQEEQEKPPTKIYQKKMYYGLEIWHQHLTYKIKTR